MWLSIAAGMLVAIGGGILGFVASIFYRPPIAKIIVILSLMKIIRYAGGVYYAYNEKDLLYKNISIIQAISRPLGFVIGVSLALFYSIGVWALVLVDVIGTLIFFFGQRWVSGYRFGMRFNSHSARKIWQFSYKMFLNRMLEMAYSRLPLLLIGCFLGTTFLGFFSQAYYLITLPNALTTSLLVKLNFVVFSKIRNNKRQLEKALFISQFITIRIMVFGVIVIFLFPEFIIKLLFGTKWLPSAPLLGKFSLFLLAQPLFNLVKSFNYAQRKQTTMMFAFIGCNLILYALILIAIMLKESSFLPYAFVFSLVAPLVYLHRRLREQSISVELINSLLYPLLAAIILICLSKFCLPDINPIFHIGVLAFLYVAFLFLKDQGEFIAIFNKLRA